MVFCTAIRKTLLVLCMAIASHSMAQTNSSEAKAAYLLAEESYGKGDYKATLEFLQQARTSLGTANCKILFLQIMATREMYAKDSLVSNRVLPLIDEFEKSADYKDFNEEKSLEITKLKLLMKREQSALKEKTDKENAARAAQALLDKPYNDLHTSLGPFRITMEELDKQKPEWKIGTWKLLVKTGIYLAPGTGVNASTPSENYPFFVIDKDDDTRNKTNSFYVDPKGLIKEYSSVLVYTDKNVNTVSPAEALKEADAIIETYKKKLGVEPKVETIDKNFDKFHGSFTQYDWRTDGGHRNIRLYRLYYPKGDLPVVKLILVTYYLD